MLQSVENYFVTYNIVDKLKWYFKPRETATAKDA